MCVCVAWAARKRRWDRTKKRGASPTLPVPIRGDFVLAFRSSSRSLAQSRGTNHCAWPMSARQSWRHVSGEYINSPRPAHTLPLHRSGFCSGEAVSPFLPLSMSVSVPGHPVDRFSRAKSPLLTRFSALDYMGQWAGAILTCTNRINWRRRKT